MVQVSIHIVVGDGDNTHSAAIFATYYYYTIFNTPFALYARIFTHTESQTTTMSKQAMKYKELGNAEFKKGNMQAAIENYCFAVEIDPRNPIFRTNRAAAYEKIGKWDKCLRDANKSIALGTYIM